MTATLIGLAAITVVMGVTMAVSLRVGRVAVVDVAWGLMFVAVAVAVAVWSPDWHSWLLAGLVTVWGGRLAWHIFTRSRGHGEDPRYAALLGEAGSGSSRLLRATQPCSATGGSAPPCARSSSCRPSPRS